MARPTSSLDLPIPFIKSENNRFTLSEEACSMLSTVENRLGVVAIAGAYRTGKSFILNRLLNRQEGFAVGPTVKPCTKGLWIWGKPVNHRLPTGEVVSLIFLDTEGLGSTDQTQTHDAQVFSLALLLSSYFVFNSVSSINEDSLNQLSLVVNLTNHIHVRSHSGPDSSEDTSELARYFPSFLWLVRDFALQLEVDGRPISSREYMENSLAAVSQPGGCANDRLQSKNKVRQLLTTFFKDRDCVTLVRPLLDERELQQLDKLPFAKCRPEFRTQVDKLREKVLTSVTPKQLNGSFLNGPMFVQLARSYVEAINNGGVPTIQNAWENVVRLESLNAVSLAVEAYREYVDSQKLTLPVDEQELDRVNLAAREKALERFRARAISGTDVAAYLKELKGRFDSDFELLKAHNENRSRDTCEQLVKDMWTKAEIDKKAYTSFQLFEQDRFKVMASFLQSAKGPSKDKALLDGLERLSVPVVMKLQEAVEREKEKLRAERDEVRRQADLALKKATDDLSALQLSLIQANQQINEERRVAKAAEAAMRMLQTDLQRQYEADVARLNEERKEMETMRKSAHGDMQRLRGENEELLRWNRQLQLEKEELVVEGRRIQGLLQQAQMERGGLEAVLHQHQVSASSSSSAAHEARAELEAAKEQIRSLKQEMADLRSAKSQQHRELSDTVTALKGSLADKNNTVAELQQKLAGGSAVERKVQVLEQEVARLKLELAKREARIADYDADLAPQDSLNGRQRTDRRPAPAESSNASAPQKPEEPRKDPQKMTIQQLMSALTAADIPLPGVKQEKPFYVKLYTEKILQK